MNIEEGSPAGRYLSLMRQSRSSVLPLDERRKAYEQATRYAVAFGFEKTRDLDALLLTESDDA